MKRLTTNSSIGSISSYQASSGRPSCSSVSGSSSNVGGHSRKCKRCGQKFFLISLNRHQAYTNGLESVDGLLPNENQGPPSKTSNDTSNYNTSTASSPRTNLSAMSFFSAIKTSPITRSPSGGECSTPTSLRNGGRSDYLKQRFCEKCSQQKNERHNQRETTTSISSTDKSSNNSPPSVGVNGFKNASNVFSFIRYTLSRILEPKTTSQPESSQTSPVQPPEYQCNASKTDTSLLKTVVSSGESTRSTVASQPVSTRPCPPNLANLQFQKTSNNSVVFEVGNKAHTNGDNNSAKMTRAGARPTPRPTAVILEPPFNRTASSTAVTTGHYTMSSHSQNGYFNTISIDDFPSSPTKNNDMPSPSTTGLSDYRSHHDTTQHVMFITPYTHIHIAGIGHCDEQLLRGRDLYSNSSGIPTTHTSLYASNHYSPTGSHMSLATTAISSGTPNDYQPSYDLDHFLDNLPTCPSKCSNDYGFHSPVDMDMLYRHNPRNCNQRLRIPIPTSLGAAYSCPTRSDNPVTRVTHKERELLCSTWPTAGKRLFPPTIDEEFHSLEMPCFSTIDDLHEPKRRSASDFNIPFDDIKLLEVIKTGKRKCIYRGNWHGEVMVHMYDMQHMETRKYWEEVEKLTTIRHENIDLFMGAAFEPTKCCVVTSARNGVTLYDKLHVTQEKTSLTFKLQVMRQLAQAIGYLHARSQKPIFVRRLTSRCVFLEPKTVLTLLDYENYEDSDDSATNQLALPPSFLYYAAPELLEGSSSANPRMIDEENFTAATDVFAFGTIVFELMANRYPLQHLESDEFIEAICSGQRGNYKDLNGSDIIKGLLKKCWTHSPTGRPFFRSISEELMHGQAAHKRHSSSEPENLHRNSVFYPSQFD